MVMLRELFACPICNKKLAGDSCSVCNIDFKKGGLPSYICREMYSSDQSFAEAVRVMDFWGNGWQKRLEESDHKYVFDLDVAGLNKCADESLAWCTRNKTLMGVDVPFNDIAGKTVLNIGCGAGGEALMLARGGASCIAMDITAQAAAATGTLLEKLGRGIGIQADARFIPLLSESVDYVYSSGVLHHSSDVPKSISEIFRVLKPGGRAYIMLYAKWSITFLQEKLLRWTGEAAWETEGRKNPCTTTYSVAECEKLFSKFEHINIGKRGASLRNFSKIGKFLPVCFDRYIDKPLGANLNIVVKKNG